MYFFPYPIHSDSSVAYTGVGLWLKCKNKIFHLGKEVAGFCYGLILDFGMLAPFLTPCFKMECKNYTINILSD